MDAQKIQRIQELLGHPTRPFVLLNPDHPLADKLGPNNFDFLTKVGVPVGESILQFVIHSIKNMDDPNHITKFMSHGRAGIKIMGNDQLWIGSFDGCDEIYTFYVSTQGSEPKSTLVNTSFENFMYCTALYDDASLVESAYSYLDMKRDFQLLEPDLPFREPESYWDNMDHLWDYAILRQLGEIY